MSISMCRPMAIKNTTAGAIALVMAIAAIAAVLMKPQLRVEATTEKNLEQILPRSFGEWSEIPSPLAQVSLATGHDLGASVDATYDETLTRTYENTRGEQVMLAVAFLGQLTQEGKIHRPELCYVAQGFQIQSLQPAIFPDINIGITKSDVIGKRILASTTGRLETISYWIRIGELYSDNAIATRLHILSEGLSGHVPNGVLVRASRVVGLRATKEELNHSFRLQERFLSDMVKSAPQARRVLIG